MSIVAKREFLMAGLGGGLVWSSQALAQMAAPAPSAPAGTRGAGARGRDVPHRTAKVTNLFKSPEMFPNALAVMTDAPGGLWVAQQKLKGIQAERYHLPEQPGPDQVFLLDWNGKLLKTLSSESEVTSGIAYGDKCLWIVANNEGDYPPPVTGVWQVDMDNKTLSVHQIPLGGGGSHGAKWHEGKLWILANRLDAMVRVDPKTWVADYAIRLVHDNDLLVGSHDFAFDDQGYIWIVMLNSARRYAESVHSLVKYDPETAKVLEIASMPVGTGYAHGLAYYNGAFYGCDAGHPDHDSTNAGWIFRIDLDPPTGESYVVR
jgi:hypothetical protein